MDYVVTATSLVKRFGHHDVLRGSSFSIPRGSITGLLGRNGAGKTTTLRILVGHAWADEGDVRVLNRNPADDRARAELAARVGYMPEVPRVPGFMKLEAALRECRRVFPRWRDEVAGRLISEFGLVRRQRLDSMSRGQVFQAAFVLAAARGPELLILDEPTSGWDPVARREFFRIVLSEAISENLSVVLASHLLEEVERICDRIAILREGRIALEGEIAELQAGGRSIEELFFELSQTTHQEQESGK